MTSLSRSVRAATHAAAVWLVSAWLLSRSHSRKAALHALPQRRAGDQLVRKSAAPALIARTLIGMSPWPVRKITGNGTPRRVNSACSCIPSIPGMRMSTMAQLRPTRRQA